MAGKMTKYGIAAAACFAGMVGSANAAVIFSDSFEGTANTRSWQVYQDFGDWHASSGKGIEVQTNRTLSWIDAQDGNQYIELDSDRKYGGKGRGHSSNSAMTRVMALVAGTYSLEYYYAPRTGRKNDNLINVYLDGASDGLMSNMIGSSDGQRTRNTDWILQTITFEVDGTDNDYALTFAAGGKANTLGGFLDNVTLTRIDVPAPAALGLLAFGLGGLAIARRRRKAT
ncbi:PEP-CTERM sorting domain-containing protein [Aestuariispira insulae]|uniref:Putative secreted protein n=1 Tax=Aestuariispira insulae TaxID=1461337 RepID=A0A3D9HWU0_9PROT|nr:PEP-CTERM sorting domain-containing protein [Aestuariispira insulae]RED53870.1 putative secreted protein [Aestuariispira insulae]